MQESYAPATGTGAGHLVHQTVARRAASLQRRIEVGNPVTNVVNPGPAPSQEPADRTVRVERREQLDLRVTEREPDDGSAIDGLRRMRLDAKDVAVERQRCLQIRDGNADVSDTRAVDHQSSEHF